MRAKKKQTILSAKVCCFQLKKQNKTKQNRGHCSWMFLLSPSSSTTRYSLSTRSLTTYDPRKSSCKRLKASVSLATGGGQYRPLTLLWNDSKQDNNFWPLQTPMHDKHPMYRKGHVSYWSGIMKDDKIKFSVLSSGWKSNNWSILRALDIYSSSYSIIRLTSSH